MNWKCILGHKPELVAMEKECHTEHKFHDKIMEIEYHFMKFYQCSRCGNRTVRIQDKRNCTDTHRGVQERKHLWIEFGVLSKDAIRHAKPPTAEVFKFDVVKGGKE